MGYVDRLPNGPIELATSLTVAITFFSGGEAYNISVMFGILQLSVFDSIDAVVDAVNGCKDMDTTFPSDHAKQHEIACRFQRKSPLAGFSICVGCIDTLVIWTHKPMKTDCEETGNDKTKFSATGSTRLV